MAKITAGYVISIVVAAILIGILLPIALNDVMGFTSDNSTIQTLVSVILPVLAVITLVIVFIPKSDSTD